jgi:hypothetical protein
MLRIVLLFLLLALISVGGCTTTGQDRGADQESMFFSKDQKIADSSDLVPFQADGIISENEYSNRITTDNGIFSLYLREDEDTLSCGLVGRCEGWIAVGFNPTLMMQDADIILGYVSNEEETVLDAYATGPTGPHPVDTELGGTYDISVTGGTESNGITTIEFSRLLNTGDQYDAIVDPGEDLKIIWALADSDIPDMRHNIARGTAEIIG